MGVGLPSHVERADLVSYGIFGLIDAVERFDPASDASSRRTRSPGSRATSSTSCAPWIAVPRSVRAKARRIEAAVSRLAAVASIAQPRARSLTLWA